MHQQQDMRCNTSSSKVSCGLPYITQQNAKCPIPMLYATLPASPKVFQGHMTIVQIPFSFSRSSKPRASNLINVHTLSSQILPRQLNLLHELRMRLGHIVECEDAVSEIEEEECAEGDEGPEWQLFVEKLAEVLGFWVKEFGSSLELCGWVVDVGAELWDGGGKFVLEGLRNI